MSVGDSIDWSEVENAASKMFSVWSGGGECEWARECWGHFADAGLAEDGDVLTRTTSFLRLVALARIYEQFCGYAWDENPETPVDYLAEDFEIDPIALGILAGRVRGADFDDANDDYSLRQAALIAVTNSMRREIHGCLAKAYGDANQLYSRMAKTNHDPDEEDDNDEFEPTGPKSAAYGFVTEGFHE